jgi:hypothetical protein
LYSILLPLHSIVRWIVVLTALAATGFAFYGWLAKKEWGKRDNQLGLFYTMAMDIQVLVGLILYFFASPLTTSALRNFSGAMKTADTRFFAIEHIMLMVVALVIAHIGRSASKKAATAVAKHRTAAVLFGLSILVILMAIPWGFRPLIRFWG